MNAPRTIVAGDCIECGKPLGSGRLYRCEACQRADAAETRELLIKMRELAASLRGALNTYDASSHGTCSKPCDLCAAIASFRTHLHHLELGVSELGARLDDPSELGARVS